MVLARAAARQLALRSVYVCVHPRPASTAESRGVLRVLQRFGEVVVFKSLRHNYINPIPIAMQAIYAEPEDAKALLDASPLQFSLETVREAEPGPEESGAGDQVAEAAEGSDSGTSSTNGNRNAEEMTRASALLQSSPTTTSNDNNTATSTFVPFSDRSTTRSASASTSASSNPSSSSASRDSPDTTTLKSFLLTANVSHLRHRDALERAPYHGPFVVDTKSAIQRDLAKRVPLLGLSEVGMKRPPPPARILVKRNREKAKWRGLRGIWEEGVREREKVTRVGVGVEYVGRERRLER